jgi:energy-coupling factor transporter transmembrane protein EcfT
MSEPYVTQERRSRLWPGIAIGLAVAMIVLAFVAGGSWILMVASVMLLWAFFGIRFLLSERGKAIAFKRFDERYEPPELR